MIGKNEYKSGKENWSDAPKPIKDILDIIDDSIVNKTELYIYMPTTIQIQERTLELLKKVRDETKSSSYDEAINKIVAGGMKKESLAGCLCKKPLKFILRNLRDKSERF